MPDKKKKIDKEFLLTDDSVNVYGFRLLTAGFQQDKYNRNPIGYRMHDRKGGVVLRWEDFRTDGDKVYAKPVINMSHPMGEQTADEIENGFLNAASVGHIVVLDTSEDKADMLPDQNGPTVTEWYCKEISLVDIPGNPNAMVQLFDKDDNEINLTDFIEDSLKKLKRPTRKKNFKPKLNTHKMDFKEQLINQLNLSDNTSEEAIAHVIRDLASKAARVKDLIDEKEKAEKELQDLKAETQKAKITDLLDKALEEKRISKEQQKVLAEDYKDNAEGLKNLLATMKPYERVVDGLADKRKDIPDSIKGKTIMELQEADLLETVISDYPDLYEELKKKEDK